MEKAKTQKVNARIQWIDIAKGLGILLVVFGHSGFPLVIQWWIYSFHMPLFFILSGLLFNPSKYKNLWEFLTKKSKGLVFPYVFFSTITLLVLVFIYHDNRFLDVAKNGWEGSALWFIPVLLFTELIYYILESFLNAIFLYIALICFALLGWYFSDVRIQLLYNFEVVLTAIAFYGIGHLFSKAINKLLSNNNWKLIMISIICLTFNIIFCYLNNVKLDLAVNEVGILPYTYISALCGFLAIAAASSFIEKNFFFEKITFKSILIYLGSNSIVILGIHQIIKMVLADEILKLNISKPASITLRHLLLWIVMYIAIQVINRYIPIVLGKSNLKSKAW